MASAEQSAGALETATIHYRAFPRAVWGVVLLRARQLGATTIIAPLSLAHHVTPDESLDLAGATLPERDLIGLVEECGRLDLALIVVVELPASPDAERLPEGWAATLAATLAPRYTPSGPLAAVHVPPSAAEWLRAGGWPHPLGTAAAAAPDFPPVLLPAVFPHLSARHTPAGPPLLRADGSARTEFWRARSIRALLATPDFATAAPPADLALLADGSPENDAHLADVLARLVAGGAAFHTLDMAAVTPAQLANYALVVAPAPLAQRLSAQQLVAPNSNLMLAGPPSAANKQAQLPWPLTVEHIYDALEARGGRVRYAWADAPGVALRVLYGAANAYLFVENRQPHAYNGTLAYRAADGAVLHAHVSLGAGRGGVLVMHDDDVLGAAMEGDGAEGGWLVRGMYSSVVFSHGSAGIVDCQGTLLAFAPQNSRFQVRARYPWGGLLAFRLLLGGAILPAPLLIEGMHLALPYVAEDTLGQTDCYLLGSPTSPLPARIHTYLAAMLRARASALHSAAKLACRHNLALGLETLASPPEVPAPASIADYAQARATFDALVAPALAALHGPHPGISADAAGALAQIAALLGE